MSIAILRGKLSRVQRFRALEEKRVKALLADIAAKASRIRVLQDRLVEVTQHATDVLTNPAPEHVISTDLPCLSSSQHLVSGLSQQISELELQRAKLVQNYVERNRSVQGWEKLEDKLVAELDAKHIGAANTEATDRFLAMKSGLDHVGTNQLATGNEE